MSLPNFTPEQMEELRALFLANDAASRGRTPAGLARQSNNLRLLPSAKNARPLFIWSADAPDDGTVDHLQTHEYPKLLWHAETGEEITIPRGSTSRELEAQKRAQGYTLSYPLSQQTVDPMEAIRAEMAQLSPEDQATVLEMARQARMEQLKHKLAGVSEADAAALATKPKASKKAS